MGSTEKGVVSRQRQIIDRLLQGFVTNKLDLVPIYQLLNDEFDRQMKARKEWIATNINRNKPSD